MNKFKLVPRSIEYQEEIFSGGVYLEMTPIPGGEFMMGSPEGEGSDKEKPQHKVTVKPFLFGKYQVTQAQWRVVASLPKVKRNLKTDPSWVKHDELPVENVSWYDAIEFCARLSKHTGKQYRLPSEAEWEYACRAGTTTPFHFGETISTESANYDCVREQMTPVGYFKVANSFGLYDMHGNVWEWCADPWHSYYEDAPDNNVWDERGANNNRYQNILEFIDELLEDKRPRVLRGGDWCSSFEVCRSASRNLNYPGNYFKSVGFRVASGI